MLECKSIKRDTNLSNKNSEIYKQVMNETDEFNKKHPFIIKYNELIILSEAKDTFYTPRRFCEHVTITCPNHKNHLDVTTHDNASDPQ